MTAPGMLAVWNNCTEGHEPDLERRFRTEHLAERVAIDGFVSGRRYVAVDAQSRYLTHYETRSAEEVNAARSSFPDGEPVGRYCLMCTPHAADQPS